MDTPDADGLERVNEAFYEAFEALSLEKMAALWEHGAEVYCVHPGSELIRGWPAVRESWETIFLSTAYLQFVVTDVHVRPDASVGVVTGVENILSSTDDAERLDAAKVVATNLFGWREGRWRMLAHHASPVLRAA